LPSLFDPVRLGELSLRNRIVMAPLTRSRCTNADGVPNELMLTYYRQRASAGMIITEAVPVSPMAIGYANLPGIWSDAQVAGWRRITEAVHKEGGCIVMQLWHVGRISDPMFLGGALPVAPSAIAATGTVPVVRPKRPFVTPRALLVEEIPTIVEAFRKGAENAQRAGFDGVELHGANGYLLDQFLEDGANHREDAYGGPVENRARFMLACADAAISVWGPGRVGMHLSPRADGHSMSDSNPLATFGHVARELGRRGIAFLLGREAERPDSIGPELKRVFGGAYVANEKFTFETATAAVARGDADAVAFGKLFLANPDLPRRFATGAALNEPRPETFFTFDPEGYVDYPALL
jgi:2,4-dienoyl-CoA reductase-like NADH-dependent reductase (Old Yellow Enzyme family)